MLDALVHLIESAGLQACGHTSAEAFLMSKESSQPACIVVDIRLPGIDGLSLHRHLTSAGIEPATVIITGHGDIPMAVAAVKAGALDFVTKPFDPEVLLDSVRYALRHLTESRRRQVAAAETRTRLNSLTQRETTILDQLVEGHPNKVIAANLGVSIRTIEHHRAHIMEKMGARTLSQLIRTALGRSD